MMEKQFCVQVSLDAREPLIGTATKADIWCLLEYTERWNEYAIKDSMLPPVVLSWLKEQQHHYPGFRPQFIKQHDRPLQAITCFFAITRQERQVLYRFQFATYEELCQLDLAALVNRHPRFAPHLIQDSLFLICTHGKHDRCCAKFGFPIYTEIAKLAGSQAWQISHIGGDKFAANILYLPQGIYYGRVTKADCQPILTAHNAHQVYLEKYRGQCAYTAIVQAADYFLRKQTSITTINAFLLTDIQTENSTLCRVTFVARATGEQHCLTIQVDPTTVTSYSACHGLKTSQTNYYRLHSHTVQSNLAIPSVSHP
jgi:hypothetical protein